MTDAHHQDPALDAFLADVTGSVDADVAQDSGCPDFAAVVAMAHQLDPSRVPAQAVAEVGQYAPVVPLAGQRRRRSTRDDVAMAAFVSQVRAAVDVDVAEAFAARASAATLHAGGAATDPAPAPAMAETQSGRRVWGAVLAVAAILLLVGGGVVSAVQLSAANDNPEPGQAALNEEPSSADQGQAEVIDTVAPRRRPVTPPATEVNTVEPEPQSAPVETPESSARVVRRKAKPRKAPRASLAELDAQARQAWRAGDREQAKQLFSQVVARGGKAQLAEMAYGDLMAIARQQKARAAEAKLWRAYLRRFPKGVYADDARAGLCRRAGEHDASSCWQRYLDDFPGGSHAKAAGRALASPEAERR